MTRKLSIFIFLLAFSSFVFADPKEFSSKDYQDVFDKAIHALVNNEPSEFKELLSPDLIDRSEKTLGDGAVDEMITGKFIPFFADYDKLDPNITETSTTDVHGNRGIAYFRVFLTDSGGQKAFAVYVLNENEKLVIGNLVINKTFREITKAVEEAKRKTQER